MKYFIKEAQRFGYNKTDLERVMTHYDISRDEAIKKIKEEGLEKLLPSRQYRNRR